MTKHSTPSLSPRQASLWFLDREAYNLQYKLWNELYALNNARRNLDMERLPEGRNVELQPPTDRRAALPSDRIELLAALIKVSSAKQQLASAEIGEYVAKLTEEARKLAQK